MRALLLALLALVFFSMFFACTTPPNYPIEPVVTYLGINKTVIEQGNASNLTDTLILRFGFTDGDGDLTSDGDTIIDAILFDSRSPELKTSVKLPFISEQGTANGISGEISIKIINKPFKICCTYEDGTSSCFPHPTISQDTFSYLFQIKDRANHFSNKVQTETIFIQCN